MQHNACTKEAATAIKSITQVCPVASFTDGGSTSGYMDFTSTIPADSIVLGWKAVTTTAAQWDNDTTAVMTVGISGATDKFSGGGAASVAAAGTTGDVGKLATNAPLVFVDTVTTPRVTITGGSDFTAFVTAADCSSTVTIYYIPLA